MEQSRTPPEEFARDEPPVRASERSFGFVFAVLFLLVVFWPLTGDGAPNWWALAPAVAFLLAALALPQVLRPLNLAWLRFGLLLHRIISPLILGMLFYLTVLPTGLVMRALRKDPLHLRFDRDAGSYWIERQPPGPQPESLRNQF